MNWRKEGTNTINNSNKRGMDILVFLWEHCTRMEETYYSFSSIIPVCSVACYSTVQRCLCLCALPRRPRLSEPEPAQTFSVAGHCLGRLGS